MIRNSGISLGVSIPGLMIVNCVFLIAMVWWAYREKDWRLWLVVVGGLLNFGERLVSGYVLDYWKIPGTTIYNNINDWLIFIGAVLYIWKKLK